MAVLKILNDKSINCENLNKNILEILVENKVYINNPCNGNGTCGKCKIKILSGKVSELTDTEKKFLKEEQIISGIRLACMTKILEDVEIEILEKEKEVEVLSQSFIRDFICDNFLNAYGVAIDIGTTTVVAELVDLRNGKQLVNSSKVNPQKMYGLDVLTRITYENEKGDEGILDLKNVLIDCINDLINDICIKVSLDKTKILKIVISANCTMMHTFLGIDARSIGVYPYKPNFISSRIVNANELGLDVSNDCICICLPHVSAFIGADIVSGIYTCDLKNIKGNVLFIDIGTNAEIVLKTEKQLISCSCAAGPALEGMNISMGMRAEIGAIEDVKINENNIYVKTIGDIKPLGLCGSGILAIIRELLKSGIIKKNGAIVKNDEIIENNVLKDRIEIENKKKKFVICENISITQSDIRQVQLAKAAILSGFTALLNECKVEMSSLDKILIAGQFGAHLPAESVVGIGILPSEVKNKIEYVGNVSKTGAYISLMYKKAVYELEELSKTVEYLELADTKDYEKIFVKSMEFPNY